MIFRFPAPEAALIANPSTLLAGGFNLISMVRKSHREITSAANPLLKVFRHALADGVTREGWVAVEGPFALEEALAASASRRGVTVQSVLVSAKAEEKFHVLLDRLPRDAEVAVVPDHIFARVAATPSPQGIAALIEIETPDIAQVLRGPAPFGTGRARDPLLLVACGLQDPGNLGTMMRSALALGASALVTFQETVSPFNPKATRSSAGAVFHLPILAGLEAANLFDKLRAAGVRTVAADRDSPQSLVEADLKGPLALLIGREASGLPAEIMERADLRLSIPIRPGMDSVNAATAASIFLYEAARQRGFETLGD